MPVVKMYHVLMVVLILFPIFASAKTLILSAPPRESSAEGEAQYGPIAKYMSKVLKEPVKYAHPKKWSEYTRAMHDGKYDIVFDGPHFAAWRIKHTHHQAIVKLPGQLNFLIFASKSNKKINKLLDLTGKRICGLPSPNLATMSAFAMFDNPVIQPNIVYIKGGAAKVYQAFKDGKCDAAVVRDQFFFKKLPASERDSLKIVSKSIPYPNQTITAGDRLSPQQIQLLQTSMTSPEGIKVSDKLLNRYSKKRKFFETADTRQYSGIEKLLEDWVWGW